MQLKLRVAEGVPGQNPVGRRIQQQLVVPRVEVPARINVERVGFSPRTKAMIA